MCVCVRERERVRERDRDRERQRETERETERGVINENVCAFVLACSYFLSMSVDVFAYVFVCE